ncbi:MAG: lipoyl(octanoyl) transferase LipB [Bacteroidales bacterium]|jgi:lipoyl(octanoyl) transferase|nr:lipoyl(octanoyl) transferase LipB [Bacteroidales bacterium]
MIFTDWNTIEYQQAWQQQTTLFEHLIAAKIAGQSTHELETIVLCEHPHVYTLGKSGKANNMLVSEAFLKRVNASFVKVDRGGDITYHGPGQIVGYPILDLENHGYGIKEYVSRLEEVMIHLLNSYHIHAKRLQGATGVWLDADSPKARKICAIGIKASRYVTMHGFALNVNTNLDCFTYINPCGFVNKGVTSMAKELGHPIDIEEVKRQLKDSLSLFLNKK